MSKRGIYCQAVSLGLNTSINQYLRLAVFANNLAKESEKVIYFKAAKCRL
jgi:hypothetical protein